MICHFCNQLCTDKDSVFYTSFQDKEVNVSIRVGNICTGGQVHVYICRECGKKILEKIMKEKS